jgi:hypothetical protein
MLKKSAPDKPTTELFIERILNREACDKHNAPLGIPCWHVNTTTEGYKPAICNERAISAGCNNKISDKSMRLNSPPRR